MNLIVDALLAAAIGIVLILLSRQDPLESRP